MSETRTPWVWLGAAQVVILVVFALLYTSPRVWLAARADDPEATTFRWRPADRRRGHLQPRVRPFESGFALKHRGHGDEAYALDDPGLEALELSRAFTVTAVVRPEGKPKKRGVIVAAQRGDERVFEVGINRHARAYVELRPTAANTRVLTPESHRRLGLTTHIAVIFEPSARASIYLDGRLAMQLESPAVPDSLGDELQWWATNRDGSDNYFPGLVGTLRFYPRALTEDELRAEVERAGLEVDTNGFPPRYLPVKKNKKKNRVRARAKPTRPKASTG